MPAGRGNDDEVASSVIEFLKTEHKKTLEALRKEIAQLRDKNTDLNYKLTLLQDADTEQQQQQQQPEPTTAAAQEAKIEALEQQCHAHQQARHALEQELNMLRAKLAAMDETVAERDAVIRTMTTEQTSLHKQCAALEQEVQRLRDDNSRYSRRQAELVMQLRNARATPSPAKHHAANSQDHAASPDTAQRTSSSGSRTPNSVTTLASPRPPHAVGGPRHSRTTQPSPSAPHEPGSSPLSPTSPATPPSATRRLRTPSVTSPLRSTAGNSSGGGGGGVVVADMSPPRDPRQSTRASRTRHRRYARPAASPTTAGVGTDAEYIQRETERLRLVSASARGSGRRRLGSANYPVVPPIAPSSPSPTSSPPPPSLHGRIHGSREGGEVLSGGNSTDTSKRRPQHQASPDHHHHHHHHHRDGGDEAYRPSPPRGPVLSSNHRVRRSWERYETTSTGRSHHTNNNDNSSSGDSTTGHHGLGVDGRDHGAQSGPMRGQDVGVDDNEDDADPHRAAGRHVGDGGRVDGGGDGMSPASRATAAAVAPRRKKGAGVRGGHRDQHMHTPPTAVRQLPTPPSPRINRS
ncbi:hypothetical protein PTSG_02178 [Salpingoeca rosetta]|uniref:CCDC92/74 N-terminal domain-containing protein n=1 Tax=Salpingoeca rosetta (strain ATCC 50818 / BSB-021) TaxID=946362 RepID=F2U1F8_SALR5|nr:uncharacterized protein PTSG_02178 [Salpingoeca rosetta]EGD81460.1 hypothetical protein PTSG_02178 [Salpingoeca rosetta]|eukprot:XP_004996664.1 hypothetical protein PTSG_02178 [Salpingoeca rosetta]